MVRNPAISHHSFTAARVLAHRTRVPAPVRTLLCLRSKQHYCLPPPVQAPASRRCEGRLGEEQNIRSAGEMRPTDTNRCSLVERTPTGEMCPGFRTAGSWMGCDFDQQNTDGSGSGAPAKAGIDHHPVSFPLTKPQNGKRWPPANSSSAGPMTGSDSSGHVPSRKLTWKLRMDRWKTIFLYNPVVLGFIYVIPYIQWVV